MNVELGRDETETEELTQGLSTSFTRVSSTQGRASHFLEVSSEQRNVLRLLFLDLFLQRIFNDEREIEGKGRKIFGKKRREKERFSGRDEREKKRD